MSASGFGYERKSALIDTATSAPEDRNWEDSTVSETIERLRDNVFMVSDEAMCQDYCFMFEHYLGWFTVTNPTQDNQVVEEIMEIRTVRVLFSRCYEMYLRYEERLHFIQLGEIQLQCPIESNDVDDYINANGSTSANGNQRMRQRGRYRYMVSQQHVEVFFMLGFTWRDIASMIGVSVHTLRRRRQEFGMNIGQ